MDPMAWAWLWVFAIVCSLTFFILVMVFDGEGRKPWHHPNSLPSSVAQIDEQTYIILDEQISPSAICRGSAGDSSTAVIEASARVRNLDGLFVRCAREQTFNDRRVGSYDFSTAVQKVATHPAFIGGSVVLFLICLLPGLADMRVAQKARKRWNRDQKNARIFEAEEAAKKAEATRNIEEQRLRELTAAFARCEISTEEYDVALSRAYGLGVPRAE